MAYIAITDMETALQTVLATVSGIVATDVNYPAAGPEPRDLPFLIIDLAGDATYDEEGMGAGSLTIERTCTLMLLAKKSDTARPKEAQAAVKPFLTSIPEKLAAYPEIRITDGRSFKVTLRNSGDAGAGSITYVDGKVYAGALYTFTVETTEFIKPTY